MSTPEGSELASFAEARRALLEALERFERHARDQESEIIARAEAQARQIVARAEERVAELDRQLARLRDEVDRARAALASMRAEAAVQEAGRPAGEDESTPVPPPSVTPPPEPQPAAAAPPAEPAGWVPSPPPGGPSAGAAATPQETLRALRAALEALNRPREGEGSGSSESAR